MNFRSFKKIYYTFDHFLYTRRNFFVYNKKIKRLIAKRGYQKNKLSHRQKKEIRDYFRANGFKAVRTDWHLFFSSANGIFDKKYIPETIFYTKIEPALNADVMFPALEDKNLQETIFPTAKQPKTIVKNMYGSFYRLGERIDIEKAIAICAQAQNFFIKPSIGSDGGKDVALIHRGKDSVKQFMERIRDIFTSYRSDFIIQEVLQQNRHLSTLNPTSINTIRILSYLRKKEVVVLSTVLRIGGLDSVVDNGNFGGISCGVQEDGSLKKYGYDKEGKAYSTTGTGEVLKGFKIPVFNEILEKVRSYHEKIPFFRIVSWDFAIDENNDIMLIEFNSRGQGINRQQLNNGPLFGAFSEEILELTQKHVPIASKLKYGK